MTKIATFSSNKLVKSKSIITSKFIEDTYSHIFEMEEIPFSCSSVVPKATERMLSALERKIAHTICLIMRILEIFQSPTLFHLKSVLTD